jgi:hypothetical protein
MGMCGTRQFTIASISDGATGYNMARNLQAKLPSSDTLRVFDINAKSIERFANETKALGSGAAVKVAANARDAAEDSVSLDSLLAHTLSLAPLNDEFVLSMI